MEAVSYLTIVWMANWAAGRRSVAAASARRGGRLWHFTGRTAFPRANGPPDRPAAARGTSMHATASCATASSAARRARQSGQRRSPGHRGAGRPSTVLGIEFAGAPGACCRPLHELAGRTSRCAISLAPRRPGSPIMPRERGRRARLPVGRGLVEARLGRSPAVDPPIRWIAEYPPAGATSRSARCGMLSASRRLASRPASASRSA